MDVWTDGDRQFEVVLASNADPDGMGLEPTDLGSAHAPSLLAFWHEDGGGFDFTFYGTGSVPFAIVERFVQEARKRVPPVGS
jgi:hypothetical protein